MKGKIYTFDFVAKSGDRILADSVSVPAFSFCHAEMLAERIVIETKLRSWESIDSLALSFAKVVKL